MTNSAILWVLLALPCVFGAREYRSIDGSNNNIANPTWGQAGSLQLRPPQNSYADPSLGTLGVEMNAVSPRRISNLVFDESSVETQIGASEMLTFWGQFMDHDIVMTPKSAEEMLSIPIPQCDIFFDPGCSSIPLYMNIARSSYSNASSVRTQFNYLSSFFDASNVYSAKEDRAAALRTFSGGLLKTSAGNLLPLNSDGWPLDNDAMIYNLTELYFTGDVRGNENPALTSLHTVFVREHNRLCKQFALEYPDWDDETLYQESRRLVIAYMQSINEHEYVPIILGKALPPYNGYNASINPGISLIFSTVGFRYGHSEVSDHILRVDESRNIISNGAIPLRQGYFNVSWIQNDGVDVILRGSSLQPQEAVDVRVVDDLRNFLFGQPGKGGLDLVAVNTMRGRDHGIPDYNTLREIYGLPRVTTWSNITKNTAIQESLQMAYNSNLDIIDPYVGGLAEDNILPANLGPLFLAIYEEQFIRLRDGDRFWYQNTKYFTQDEINSISNTRLADIILRNTNINNIQCYVFSYSSNLDCSRVPVGTSTTLNPTTAHLSTTTTNSSNFNGGNVNSVSYFNIILLMIMYCFVSIILAI